MLIISILTVLLVRIFGFAAIHLQELQFVYYDHSYHLYYGILIVAVSFLLKTIRKKYFYIFLAIGLGLVIDDIFVIKYIILGPPKDPIADYWSPLSVIPLLFGFFLMSYYEKSVSKK